MIWQSILFAKDEDARVEPGHDAVGAPALPATT
jgi:hypothetical protein